MPRVSVVIRCFNEAAHIGTLLERLTRQTLTDHEVIVVDSGSTDETLAIAARFLVRIIQIDPAEFTFGSSLNRGCALASGEFLIFASAHVIPCADDWLERLVAPFADPGVALVYGRQVGHTTTKFPEHRVFSKQFPAVSNSDQRIAFCNNANAAVRRSLWARNPYDEALTGLEDLAWGKWAVAQGYKIAYMAEAAVIHIHNETPDRIRNRYQREAMAFKHIFPDSHMKVFEFAYLLVRHMLSDGREALRQGVFMRSIRDILVFRTMQYWGTFLGMNSRSPVTHELIRKFYYPEPVDTPEPIRGGVLPDVKYDGHRT
jgi:rhamnosyltransferase